MGEEFGRGPSDRLPAPPPLDESVRASLVKSLIIGTPDQVAGRIKQFAEVLGPDLHFVARSNYPGIPHELAMDSITRLATVKPLLP